MNPSRQEYFQTSGGPNAGNTPAPDNFSEYGAEPTKAFTPGNIFKGMFSDMSIKSSDQTEYYVHRRYLSRLSTNAFAGLLVSPAFSIPVLEPATVLSIVVHTIYGMSSTHYNPSLDTIEAAIDALIKYGVAPHPYACSSEPLYMLLLSHAPYRPIDAYALAGKHGFEDAAVAISAHLLAYDLFQISDALSIKMGPVYLRRLVNLHTTRVEALKGIVPHPPAAHPATSTCGGADSDQSQLMGGWAYATAELAWAVLPGISTNALQSAFEKAGEGITCQACQVALRARIQEVCWEWSAVKKTI